MPDQFTNARPYFDVAFPNSGDGFSIASMKNAVQGLGFLDMIPGQPRAHNPADMRVMVRGRDASSFFNPFYFGDADQRIPFSSGDSAVMTAPVSNPRIDIVYLTPSGDIRVATGAEAVTPALPSLAPSGDTRLPICAIYHRTTETKIVNFEDKDSNTGDGYIYQDIRPWIRTKATGSQIALSDTIPIGVTGDNAVGTDGGAARANHRHQGVHTVRTTGSGDLYGDITLSAEGGTRLIQQGNEIKIYSRVVQVVAEFYNDYSGALTTLIPNDTSIPQNNEGDQIIEVTITPKDALNWLKIESLVFFTNVTGANIVTLALFNGNIVNAIRSSVAASDTSNLGPRPLPLVHWMLAGTTTPITFKLRIGGNSGTTYVNGVSTQALQVGSLQSNVFVTEYAK